MGTPDHIKEIGNVIYQVIEEEGGMPITGIAEAVGRRLKRKVPLRHIRDGLQYIRRTSPMTHPEPIVYVHTLDMYGFPANLKTAEAHIVSFNGSYLATRCETFAEQTGKVRLTGDSKALRDFEAVATSAALSMRTVVDTHAAQLDTIDAKRTGANAQLKL